MYAIKLVVLLICLWQYNIYILYVCVCAKQSWSVNVAVINIPVKREINSEYLCIYTLTDMIKMCGIRHLGGFYMLGMDVCDSKHQLHNCCNRVGGLSEVCLDV